MDERGRDQSELPQEKGRSSGKGCSGCVGKGCLFTIVIAVIIFIVIPSLFNTSDETNQNGTPETNPVTTEETSPEETIEFPPEQPEETGLPSDERVTTELPEDIQEAFVPESDEFILMMTYNSNAIEGSRMTIKETEEAIAGKTVKGRELFEVLEAVDHKNAMEFMVKEGCPGFKLDEK